MLRLFSVFAGVWYKTRVIAKNKYEVLLSSLLTTASCDHRDLLAEKGNSQLGSHSVLLESMGLKLAVKEKNSKSA